MSSPVVSIIICTRNRASDLKATLAAMARIEFPAHLPVEIVIVDNDSSDYTRQVVAEVSFPFGAPRYLFHGHGAKAACLNRAIEESNGSILLFTDDDVRPPARWIERMCGPIQAGLREVVAGAVRIAPHLRRPWMTDAHRVFLAEPTVTDGKTFWLVGANMAFSRSVLDHASGFDERLGPGALGFGEETLFSLQLQAAGFRLAYEPDAVVEHHFEPSRLTRKALLNRARAEGRSSAYIDYHWRHVTEIPSRAALRRQKVRLAYYRMKRIADLLAPGVANWELEMVRESAYAEHLVRESSLPRAYEKQDVSKLSAEATAKPALAST